MRESFQTEADRLRHGTDAAMAKAESDGVLCGAAGQVAKLRGEKFHEQEMREFLQVELDRLRRAATAKAEVLRRKEHAKIQEHVFSNRQQLPYACPRNNPAMLGDTKHRLSGKSMSNFSFPERHISSSNEGKKLVMNKFLKSVPRPAMPNTTIKPKPERAIDDDSNALFTYHQRINETRNPGTNWLRAQSYPEFVSGLRAIRSTKLFIANAEKAVIHPQNVFETCQQQNKTHPHAQILDITELGVQNQNNLTTEIKRFSQDKRTHDTKRRLDGEQPQEKNHTRPISRNGMETRSQANGVAIQNISVKLPRYPGSGCVDQPLKSSYHNVPVMANIGERILQISIRPETINTHRTCGTQTDTLNAVNGKPFSSLAPSCRTVNQVSAQRPENDESSYVILSRNPSHSSGDSKPPHQTNTGPLSHSLHLHPRPAVQCPSNILNIPYPSTLTVILNRTPILPDSSYHRNFLTVIICPCCQKHISLCYSGTKDCQTATDTDSSPKGRDTINVVNGSGSPTPGTAGGSAKRIATVHVSSYETSSTHIQVAMNKPQSRADMVNMAKNGGDKVLHPETRLENSANLVEKNNNSAKFLHPTTTAGKKPHKSPVPKETFQARRTKADSKECATKTDAVPVDNAGTSEIAATCGVKDEDQQAKGKVINSKSTTSTVLQEPVILREFLSKVVGAGHEKNILSKIGVVRYISEVFQEVFGHLKECGSCSASLSHLVEKLYKKLPEQTSSLRENSAATTSPWQAYEDLLDDDRSDYDFSSAGPSGQVDDECVLEPYVDRFHFAKEQLDNAFPEHVVMFVVQDTCAYSGRSSLETRRGADTRVARSQSSTSRAAQTCVYSEERPSKIRSTRATVELELSDNKTSRTSAEVIGKSDGQSQRRDPGPADLERGAGILQPSHDSPRTSSSTRHHLDCSIAEDTRRVAELCAGEDAQVPGGWPSTTEKSTEARSMAGSTASPDRILGDGAAVPDAGSGAISMAYLEEPGSGDTRTIKPPVSLPGTTISASTSPRSEKEQQPSEEPTDTGRYVVRTLERLFMRTEVMKRTMVSVNDLFAKCQEKHHVTSMLADDSQCRGRQQQQQRTSTRGESHRPHIVHERQPVKTLKEVRTVPRGLNYMALRNGVLLTWEKPDLRNCPVAGFEIHVNSELHQRIRSNLQEQAFISGVDLSKKVTIDMYAITPQGRLHKPARLILLPTK